MNHLADLVLHDVQDLFHQHLVDHLAEKRVRVLVKNLFMENL